MDKTKRLLENIKAMGINTDGIEIKEETNIWDLLITIGCSEIIIADDARTFDTRDMERMEAEGRVLERMPLNDITPPKAGNQE